MSEYMGSQLLLKTETEKALILYEHCSAVIKTPLYYQHSLQHKSKMELHSTYYE